MDDLRHFLCRVGVELTFFYYLRLNQLKNDIMLNEKINSVVVGATGLSGSVVAPDVIASVAPGASDLVNVVVQILIGIATIIGLFKKNKK